MVLKSLVKESSCITMLETCLVHVPLPVVISAVGADGLAPMMLQTSTGTVMNGFGSIDHIYTGPLVRGQQLWRRTRKFLLIFLQFYVYDLRFKVWGPTTILTEFQTLIIYPWWPIQTHNLVSIGSGNGLVPAASRPSPEPMLEQWPLWTLYEMLDK